MKWEISARSETGYVREENQDRMGGFQLGLGQVYIVADGMGGHKGGALAAELTVANLQQHLSDASPQAPAEEVIRQAFEKTNALLYERAHCGDQDTEGMGAAVVLLLISGSVARVAHVGDSRAYLYRKGRLQQLTTDHTRVQRMIDAGMLTPQQAREHPEASLLERAVGHKPHIEVDIGPDLLLEEGDGILLCSDGLSGYIDDREIETMVRSGVAVQEIADRLVNLALGKGGHDNITVQFIQYGERKEVHGKNRGLLSRIIAAISAMVPKAR